MKLNYDCVRAVLLYIEKVSKPFSKTPASTIISNLSDYKADDIIYSIVQLEKEGYISVNNLAHDVNGAGFVADVYLIEDITPEGRKFLDSVRDGKVWKHVKLEISKLAELSFPIVQQIAIGFVKQHLGLQ